jgi:hypothetical protein
MKPRKPKAEETLLDQLSKPLRDIVADLKTHSADSVEKLRERDPAKYIELSIKLIALIHGLKTEKGADDNRTKTREEISRGILRSCGLADEFVTDAVVEQVAEANDAFMAALEVIKAKAEGEIH